MKLTISEIVRGWVVHTCPVHGPLIACSPKARVFCGESVARGKRCNKQCSRVPWASAKPLQNKG